jgi:hypothetical protein
VSKPESVRLGNSCAKATPIAALSACSCASARLLRHDALVDQLGVVLVDERGVLHRCPVLGQLGDCGAHVRFVLSDDDLEGQRIDEGAALPGLHRGVVITEPGLDVARDVRAHCAVTTGLSAPVMLTARWMSPRVTRAVT